MRWVFRLFTFSDTRRLLVEVDRDNIQMIRGWTHGRNLRP